MTTTAPAASAQQPVGKVIKKKRTKKAIELATVVGPIGVPKLYNDISKVSFTGSNSKKLHLLLAIYAQWGRTIGPAYEFEDFVLKLEKFSGAHNVRRMIDALRRGEDLSGGFSYGMPTSSSDDTIATDANDTDNNGNADFNDADLQDAIDEHERNNQPSNPPPPAPSNPLTQEQLDKIERNRLLALERRRQREEEAAKAKAQQAADSAASDASANDKDKDADAEDKSGKDEGKMQVDDEGDIEIVMDDDVSHADIGDD